MISPLLIIFFIFIQRLWPVQTLSIMLDFIADLVMEGLVLFI